MLFDGFYGNEKAKKALSGAFDSGRVPHAVLIDGPEGSGKKMLAGIIARAAVCEGEGQKPCGECRSCKKALSGNHPDIMSYSAGGAARSFSVDTVRKIRMDAFVGPNDGERKVYILSGVHLMTEQAQNAILKILEEPPDYVVFILTCEGRSRVLQTVQSRSMLITLGPVSQDEAVKALLSGTPGCDRETAEKAAEFSGLLIGRAKKRLEEESFTAAASFFREFVYALCSAKQYEFLRLSGRLEKDTELFHTFIELLPLVFRDAAASKAGVDTRVSGYMHEADNLASRLILRQIYKMLELSLEAQAAVDRYANTTLLLTWLFSRMWQEAHEKVLD